MFDAAKPNTTSTHVLRPSGHQASPCHYPANLKNSAPPQVRKGYVNLAAAVFLYNLTCTKSPQVLQAACSPSLLIPAKRLLASLHVPLQTALLAYLRNISMSPKRTYLQDSSTFGNLSKLLG